MHIELGNTGFLAAAEGKIRPFGLVDLSDLGV
jgi:hypothetical protein